MDLKEALPLLQENHLAVATSVASNGRSQATVVSTALMDVSSCLHRLRTL
jgi:hypothetical protein